MNAEHIQRTAADWLTRRIGDDWTEQDEAEFDLWIDADVAHRIQYLRIEAAWHHTARLKALGAGIPAGAMPRRNSWGDARYYCGNIDLESEPTEEAAHEPGSTEGTPKRFRYLALAASALLCVIASGYVSFNYLEANHYTTAVGATDTVSLQDGSHITLNTDTSIHVALTEHERRIQLDRGEAFFEVAEDKSRPFVVYAGDKRVVAVGTKFAVRRERDDVQVAVTEGKVRLEDAAEPSPTSGPVRERRAAHDRSAGGPVFLAAGAVARTADAHVTVDQNAIADADRLLAWRRGYVAFDNTPLTEAVAELNRYNTRKIAIQDPAIADIRIGGSFRATNTDAFLELLRSGHSIVIEREADTVILKAR